MCRSNETSGGCANVRDDGKSIRRLQDGISGDRANAEAYQGPGSESGDHSRERSVILCALRTEQTEPSRLRMVLGSSGTALGPLKAPIGALAECCVGDYRQIVLTRTATRVPCDALTFLTSPEQPLQHSGHLNCRAKLVLLKTAVGIVTRPQRSLQNGFRRRVLHSTTRRVA